MLLCLSVLRPDQRQRINTASLRPAYKELLKLCHKNRVVSEVFTQPDAILCRPFIRKVEAVVRLEKELMEKRASLKINYKCLQKSVYCILVAMHIWLTVNYPSFFLLE